MAEAIIYTEEKITEIMNLAKENQKLKYKINKLQDENSKLKQELKEQIEHYKYSMMQIDDVLVSFLGVTHEIMDKPSDFEKVLEEKISSYKDRIRELEKELKYKDGTKMFETLMENTDGEAKDLLAQHMYENLKCVWTNARMEDDVKISNILPFEPIKVADMLISARVECGKNEHGIVFLEYNLFDIPQLRQIAQHLLIYCDSNEKE